MRRILQGIALGWALILPGISGGTALVLMGLHRQFVADLSALRLRPYTGIIAGALAGALSGAALIGFLMARMADPLAAFLGGALLASLKVVAPVRWQITFSRVTLLAAGLAAALLLGGGAGSPLLTTAQPFSWGVYLAGGFVSSATMLLPGVSGSSMLIIIGLYDDLIVALNERELVTLAVLSIGWAGGLLSFARLLNAFYRRYSQAFSFLLTGLIIGSAINMLPPRRTAVTAAALLLGAATVYLFTRKEQSFKSR